MLSDEQFEELGVVNQIRQQVRSWREAVSNWGQMGRWLFDHCGGPGSVKAVLARHGFERAYLFGGPNAG